MYSKMYCAKLDKTGRLVPAPRLKGESFKRLLRKVKLTEPRLEQILRENVYLRNFIERFVKEGADFKDYYENLYEGQIKSLKEKLEASERRADKLKEELNETRKGRTKE